MPRESALLKRTQLRTRSSAYGVALPGTTRTASPIAMSSAPSKGAATRSSPSRKSAMAMTVLTSSLAHTRVCEYTVPAEVSGSISGSPSCPQGEIGSTGSMFLPQDLHRPNVTDASLRVIVRPPELSENSLGSTGGISMCRGLTHCRASRGRRRRFSRHIRRGPGL